MIATCIDCGDITFLQNKKGQCGDCVFKKNHGGRSREEVYAERAEKKKLENKIKKGLSDKGFHFNGVKLQIPTSYKIIQGGFSKNFFQDPESVKNERNQNLAEENEKSDEDNYPLIEKKNVKKLTKFLKKKSVKKITPEQTEINNKYRLVIIDMDYTRESVCTGCLRYQGGDIKLSHSHIISRKECKEIGREDLIYDLENLTYHCMDFGDNEGCHRIWENPKRRHTLKDYEKNTKYINRIRSEIKKS